MTSTSTFANIADEFAYFLQNCAETSSGPSIPHSHLWMEPGYNLHKAPPSDGPIRYNLHKAPPSVRAIRFNLHKAPPSDRPIRYNLHKAPPSAKPFR